MQLSYENFEFFGQDSDLVNRILDEYRMEKMDEVEAMMFEPSSKPDLRLVK